MYPPTRRTGASSSYRSQLQGTVVIDDPYRWLEQDNTERRAWALGLFLTYQKLRSVLILLSSRSAFNYVPPPISRMGRVSNCCQKESRIRPGSKNVIHVPHHDWLWCLSLKFDAPFQAHDKRWYWMARSGAQKQHVLYRSVSESLPNAGEDGLEDLESVSELVFDVRRGVFPFSFVSWADRFDSRIHSEMMGANRWPTGLCHRTKSYLPLPSALSLVLIVSHILWNCSNASFLEFGHKWHISTFQRWQWAKHRGQTDRRSRSPPRPRPRRRHQ